jgi:hypothetical protein
LLDVDVFGEHFVEHGHRVGERRLVHRLAAREVVVESGRAQGTGGHADEQLADDPALGGRKRNRCDARGLQHLAGVQKFCDGFRRGQVVVFENANVVKKRVLAVSVHGYGVDVPVDGDVLHHLRCDGLVQMLLGEELVQGLDRIGVHREQLFHFVGVLLEQVRRVVGVEAVTQHLLRHRARGLGRVEDALVRVARAMKVEQRAQRLRFTWLDPPREYFELYFFALGVGAVALAVSVAAAE